MSSKKIVTYDPDLKLSKFKEFQIRFNNRKERFKINLSTNKNWIFFKDLVSDIFIYSSCGAVIMLPFFSNYLIMGLSLGAGLWLYTNLIHDKIKELLGAINFVTNIKYGK